MLEKTYRHKGWLLVETGHNYYHACKGNLRVVVGPLRRADFAELVKRFREIVDGLEA